MVEAARDFKKSAPLKQFSTFTEGQADEQKKK
jgi:hypothetical protein